MRLRPHHTQGASKTTFGPVKRSPLPADFNGPPLYSRGFRDENDWQVSYRLKTPFPQIQARGAGYGVTRQGSL